MMMMTLDGAGRVRCPGGAAAGAGARLYPGCQRSLRRPVWWRGGGGMPVMGLCGGGVGGMPVMGLCGGGVGGMPEMGLCGVGGGGHACDGPVRGPWGGGHACDGPVRGGR